VTLLPAAEAPITPSPAGSAKKPRQGIGLGRYIAIRAALILPTVLILVTLVFFMMRVVGDPISAAVGDRLTPEQLEERLTAAGFNRPLIVQYFEYLGQVFTGNFGRTLTDNRPVVEVLLQYGAATFELVFYALIVAFVLGIPFGLVAAYRKDRTPDAILRILAILAYATPVFFSGLLLKLIFGVWLGVLPLSGRADTRVALALNRMENSTGLYLIDAIRLGSPTAVADVLAHAVLPALTLGLLTAGVFLRLVRTNVISTLSNDYVDAARSRGVSEFRLVTKHAYKPALIPIITVIGLQIALLLGGAVLTETTFEWRGLGFQLTQYLNSRDFVAVQGIVALLVVIVALTNFLVDVIAAFIDPRVRY
jgi:peptide/nickel transport system permease protein